MITLYKSLNVAQGRMPHNCTVERFEQLCQENPKNVRMVEIDQNQRVKDFSQCGWAREMWAVVNGKVTIIAANHDTSG